jgi:hypothetical protein
MVPAWESAGLEVITDLERLHGGLLLCISVLEFGGYTPWLSGVYRVFSIRVCL